MSMISVSSSAIAAIGYEGGTLYVTFHTGRTYPHPGVPYSVFLGLLHAESKGTYYNEHIRGKYK
jgi:KTSC domain-containing protein